MRGVTGIDEELSSLRDGGRGCACVVDTGVFPRSFVDQDGFGVTVNCSRSSSVAR